jgi:uncharacterized membrane protein YkoI
VTNSSVDLTSRDGKEYYKISFTTDSGQYEYNVDALTGVIIDSSVPANTAPTEEAPATEEVPQETAPAAETPQAATPDTSTSATSYTVPAQQSSPKSASQTTQSGSQSGQLTVEQAKAKALEHAGLSASAVTYTKAKLDWDDGRQVYEIEFYTADYTEYEYDIDASTGAVVKYDVESKSGKASKSGSTTNSSSTGTISADQAKKLALQRVPGATEANIVKFKTDHDDGRTEYEGEIRYNGYEYEFEIDAYSGAIRSWEVEAIDD